MPGWHQRTAELVAAGELVVVGIAQEQHRERTALYLAWQGIEWPVLWDPFNLTGSRAVPNAILVASDGTVVSTRARQSDVDAVIERERANGAAVPAPPTTRRAPHLSQLDRLTEERTGHLGQVSRILFGGFSANEYDAPLAALDRAAEAEEARADHIFWSGVAHRLAYDEAGGSGPGFARAVARWSKALALNPSQYIWRRRIQQYGPRMDKPYDFYAWVAEARTALAQSGATVSLRVALTPTELAVPADAGVALERPVSTNSDFAELGYECSVVQVPDTADPTRAACLHVALRPRDGGTVPPGEYRVWIGDRSGSGALASDPADRTLRFCVDIDPAALVAGEPVELRFDLPGTGGARVVCDHVAPPQRDTAR